MRRGLLLCALLLAAVVPARAAAEDQVVTPFTTDFTQWFLTTETTDGVVTGNLPVPTYPIDYEALPNGGAVFRGGEASGMEGIWLAEPGQAPVRLTNNVLDAEPTATRNGSRVVFSRYDSTTGSSDIYAVNGNGSGLTRLTDSQGLVQLREPELSPDGSTIAYTCKRAADPQTGIPVGGQLRCGPQVDGAYEETGVVLMNADGSNPRLIFRADSYALAWSPDARWLALTADIPVYLGGNLWTDSTKMFVIRSDGTDLFADRKQERVVKLPMDPSQLVPFWPSFSADGARLAFGGALPVENANGAFVASLDGSSFQRLTNLQTVPWDPVIQFALPATGAAPPPTVDATHLVVPPMHGLKEGKAENRLEARHFEVVGVVARYSSRYRRGRVIGTKPRAGAKSHRLDLAGAPVTIYVSKGRRHRPHRRS